MPKHPLYDIFRAHSMGKPVASKSFQPIPDGHLVKSPSLSTDHKKMATLILAGGEGSRLDLTSPKGCAELFLKSKKSLFQIHFERVKAKGEDLPLAIMTSPLNHDATAAYLQRNDYFGLTNVELFQQDLIPMCDDRGELIRDEEEKIVKAPDGNGKALLHLYNSGVWRRWKGEGIEVVQVIPIDNPLAEPFDPELLTQHQLSKVDLVLKSIKREDPDEKLGVVGVEERRLHVREYSEPLSATHSLEFAYGNIGIFSCTLDFVKEISTVKLPWHLARKQREKTWIWKFETFIFDIFPYAKSFKVVVGERKNCFSPIKDRRDLLSFNS